MAAPELVWVEHDRAIWFVDFKGRWLHRYGVGAAPRRPVNPRVSSAVNAAVVGEAPPGTSACATAR